MSDGFTEQRREEIIQILTDAFARDTLTTEEYEHRVEQANRINSISGLNSLVADLTGPGAGNSRSLQVYPAAGTLTLRSIFSNQQFDGDWLSNEHVLVRTFMGSVTCDFHRPVLGPVTRVEIRSIMGEVKLVIPKGVKINVNISPILGEVTRHRGGNRFLRQVKGLINTFLGNEDDRQVMNPHSHPGATIEVYGSAFMSSVRIIEREPGYFD